MGRYVIAVQPTRFCYRHKFVLATAYSQVDDCIVAWLTNRLDEALIIESENEARSLLYELQIRYPFKDFEVWDIKGYNL